VLELEWTVGPLTSGRDICLRVSSNLTSGAIAVVSSVWPGTRNTTAFTTRKGIVG